jgi:hypothetical protein
MFASQSLQSTAFRLLGPAASVMVLTAVASVAHAQALVPGNLVVSRSVYTPNRSVKVGDILPPNCTSTTGGCAAGTGAIADSVYPYVFNNDTYDASFGITSKILLDQITVHGQLVSTWEVPNSTQTGITPTSDQLVTSFSSKSELGLHLSLDKKFISFMGYVAPVNSVDISNSNTPGAQDPTNPVGLSTYRAAATVDANGNYTFTETNAYSGNNGRSAILNDLGSRSFFYTAGNAGNGANPQPDNVILGAGAQFLFHSTVGEYQQNPGTPIAVGSFNVTELGDKADKIGKDDNFRGLTVFNNVVYLTKGSGSNGVNTVYFIDTTNNACPNGVGLPRAGAPLPVNGIAYTLSSLESTGLRSNMCILKGFPTALAKKADPVAYPFGLWFADANTLYVADEGDGYTGGSDLYTHAAAQPMAGLQKWVYNSTSRTWTLAYTLQTNLGLGAPRSISAYPTGINSVTGLPWAPATDGLRNITGLVGDGTYPELPTGKVAIYGVTSTISGNGDVGADPNLLLVVIDDLANTDPSVAAKESYYTVRYAGAQEVLRGVSFTPGTASITSY